MIVFLNGAQKSWCSWQQYYQYYKCSVRSFILAYAVPAWQDIPETLTVVLTNKVKTNSRYFVGVFS